MDGSYMEATTLGGGGTTPTSRAWKNLDTKRRWEQIISLVMADLARQKQQSEPWKKVCRETKFALLAKELVFANRFGFEKYQKNRIRSVRKNNKISSIVIP